MFRFGSHRSKAIVSMETSAMTDIIFLLLIFFLLTSSFILRTEIPVSIPKSTSTITEKEQPVVVTVSRDGTTYVDEDKVEFEELATAMGTRLASSGSKAVIIRGDEAVNLGLMVRIMDIAREAGAEKLAIATEQESRRR